MKKDRFIKIAPWCFLGSALYLPAFELFFIATSLLSTELYGKLYPVLNPLTMILVKLIPMSVAFCIVLAIATGIMTKGKTFSKLQWWFGSIAFGIAFLIALAAILLLPHPPD